MRSCGKPPTRHRYREKDRVCTDRPLLVSERHLTGVLNRICGAFQLPQTVASTAKADSRAKTRILESHTVYVAMGGTVDGDRDALGLWVGPSGGKGVKQYMTMLAGRAWASSVCANRKGLAIDRAQVSVTCSS